MFVSRTSNIAQNQYSQKTININKIAKEYLTPRLITAKQLDVNTLVTENTKATQNPNNTITGNEPDTKMINYIVNNNISKNFRVTKYLGEGINGRLYLVKNKSDNALYICKLIVLPQNVDNTMQNKQINFELNILKYLGQNEATREYINPCIEHKVINNHIFTIFPVFNGYSLSNLQNYLVKLNKADYYKIVFYLVKNILQGLAVIHDMNIAHLNINDNAILVSSESKKGDEYNLPIKFTDFGLGCGKTSDIKQTDVFLRKCSGDSQIPVKITKRLLDSLDESGYMKLAIKWDIFCLGCLLVKLMLPDVRIPIEGGYSENVARVVGDILLKINSKEENGGIKLVYNGIEGVSDDIKISLGGYLDAILRYMVTETGKRERCQYVLDKVIIYEKYKNDYF